MDAPSIRGVKQLCAGLGVTRNLRLVPSGAWMRCTFSRPVLASYQKGGGESLAGRAPYTSGAVPRG